MMRLQQGLVLAIMCLTILMGCNCLHPNQENVKSVSRGEKQVTTQKASGVRAPHKGDVRVAFTYPVVAVNGQRVSKVDSLSEEPEQLIVYYPQNSANDITLTFIDAEGNEQQLQGTIKVFQYTQFSKLEGEEGEIVTVSPDNSEYTYESIWHNGYGQLTVREYVKDPTKVDQLGAVLVQLELGSKKKKR